MDTTSTTPFPILDSAPMASQHDASTIPALSSPSDPAFELAYEGPLYTEINIPLPRIPTSYQPTTAITSRNSSSKTTTTSERPRSRTLTLSRFRQRSSSSATSTSTSTSTSSSTSPKRHSADATRPRSHTVKSREVNAMMDLRHQSKKAGRNGAIDALAVVPAVLVLSAELFTPGTEAAETQGRGRRKDSGVGRWEEGIR